MLFPKIQMLKEGLECNVMQEKGIQKNKLIYAMRIIKSHDSV